MTMTHWMLAALTIFFIQTLLPASIRFLFAGDTSRLLSIALGPRDTLPEMPVIGERAARALNNMHEAMPVFLTLALLSILEQKSTGVAATGAMVFVIARALYVPAYMSGVIGVRSVVWVASWFGLGAMIYALLV